MEEILINLVNGGWEVNILEMEVSQSEIDDLATMIRRSRMITTISISLDEDHLPLSIDGFLKGCLQSSSLLRLGLSGIPLSLNGAHIIAALIAKSEILLEFSFIDVGFNDDMALVIANALPESRSISHFDVFDDTITDVGTLALCRAAERTREITIFEILSENKSEEVEYAPSKAIARKGDNSRLLAFMTPVSQGIPSSTPHVRFFRKDGDTAIGHRVASFLV